MLKISKATPESSLRLKNSEHYNPFMQDMPRRKDKIKLGGVYRYGKDTVQVAALGFFSAQVRLSKKNNFCSETFLVERANLKKCRKLKSDPKLKSAA